MSLGALRSHMLTGKHVTKPAIMANRERALRLEVRVHAPKPSPYGWEIYDCDDSEAQPIKCSQGTYRTEEAARKAGDTAMMRMTKEDYATRA
jgi:hypothetical protein